MSDSRNTDRIARLALAADDQTSAAILTRLATDDDAAVRRAVASNPNTPQDVLLKLGKEFPDAIVANPIFNILLLENPESLFVRLSLARSSTSPSETLANLSALPDEEILCAIAENPNTPVATLEQLVQNPPQIYDYDDPDGTEFDRLFTCVAKNPNTPESLLIRLAKGIMSASLSYAVAQHANAPAYLLEQFADFPNVEMHRAILRNPNTPTTALEKLAGEEFQEIRAQVKAHPNASPMAIAIGDFMDQKPGTPLDLLPVFATHSRPAVRRLVASYPHTPSPVLDKLSLDSNDSVVATVGEHPNASATSLENAAQRLVIRYQQAGPSNRQGYERAAIELVKRSNITGKVLETLLRMGPEVAVAIAACPAAPPETLLDFIESKEQFQKPRFWSVLASNPNTPVEGLEILFSRLERASDVRALYEIARHPNVSGQLLKKLAPRCLQNPTLCSLVLKNPAMPGEVLRWLADHPHIKETYNAESLIAAHPNTPVDLLLRFVTDPSVSIRQGLASNTHAPVAILETLANEEDELVHANLLANPSTPVDILERFATHLPNERLGESLISNPKTSAKLLARLADAPNRKIRQGVAVHPNTSPDTVIKLAADQNYLVRQAILQRSDLTERVLETLAEKTFAQAEADKPERMDEWNVPGGKAMTLSEMLRASTAGKAFTQAEPQEQDEMDEANVSGKAAHPVNPVQEGLAKNNYGDILEGIAKHPKTPAHILEKLATNQPETLYHRLGDVFFWSIRKAIASNSSTPIALLEQLAEDDQADVKAAARKMLKEKL